MSLRRIKTVLMILLKSRQPVSALAFFRSVQKCVVCVFSYILSHIQFDCGFLFNYLIILQLCVFKSVSS